MEDTTRWSSRNSTISTTGNDARIPRAGSQTAMAMPQEGGRVMNHSRHSWIREAEIPVENFFKGFRPVIVEDALKSLPVGALVRGKIGDRIRGPSDPRLLDKMIYTAIWEMSYSYGCGVTLDRYAVQIQNVVIALGDHKV